MLHLNEPSSQSITLTQTWTSWGIKSWEWPDWVLQLIRDLLIILLDKLSLSGQSIGVHSTPLGRLGCDGKLIDTLLMHRRIASRANAFLHQTIQNNCICLFDFHDWVEHKKLCLLQKIIDGWWCHNVSCLYVRFYTIINHLSFDKSSLLTHQ